MSREAGGGGDQRRCRYKGVRRRRWGKWVSEIRVPGTRERLWLGSYATAEAAAVAHDAAVCLLRGRGAYGYAYGAAPRGAGQLSPRSVQRVASDAGMAADAQLVELRQRSPVPGQDATSTSTASVGAGIGIAQGGAAAREQVACGSRRSCSNGSDQLVYGDLSVDDMEILML